MSSARELLALRKEVLLARSSLQRLTVARDVHALREALRWPRAMAALAGSPASRSLAFGLVALVAGRWRMARALRVAAVVVGIAKLAHLAWRRAQPAAAEGATRTQSNPPA